MIPEAGTGGNMFYSSLSEVGNEHNIYLFIERRNQKSTLPSRKLEAQSRKINPPQYKFHHVPCACWTNDTTHESKQILCSSQNLLHRLENSKLKLNVSLDATLCTSTLEPRTRPPPTTIWFLNTTVSKVHNTTGNALVQLSVVLCVSSRSARRKQSATVFCASKLDKDSERQVKWLH